MPAPVSAEEILSHFQHGPERVQPRVSTQVEMLNPLTGNVVNVAPEEAQQAWTGGRLNLLPGTELPVQLADGRLGTVPSENAQEALGQGARIVSLAAVHRDRVARDVGAVESFARGAVHGAMPSLGLLELPYSLATGKALPIGQGQAAADLESLLTGADPEAIRERQQIAREEHPWASGAGELGGLISSGLLGGGKASPILGPGIVAEQLAGRAVGKGATTLAARVAQRAAPLAARGAVEGALLGVDASLDESRLGDRDVAAEKLLADIGYSALVGGGIGGIFGGLAGLRAAEAGATGAREARALALPKATPSAVEKVAEREFGFVPKGLGDAYVQAVAPSAEGAEGILREAGVQNQSAAGRAARKALLDIDEVQDAASRAVRSQLDELMGATRSLTEETRNPLKRGYLEKTVSREAPEAVGQSTWDLVMRTHQEIESMLADEENFGLTKSLKSIKNYIERENYKILDAVKKGDNAEQFAILDDVKRSLGRWTKSAQAIERTPDPYDLDRGRATRDALEKMYETYRGHLEDVSLWGKAAEDQRAINAAWSRQIAASREFNKSFTTNIGQDTANTWRDIYGADPAKVDSYVRNLTNPRQDLTHKAVLDYVQASRDLADAIKTAYDIPPEKVAQVARARKAVDDFTTTVAKTEQSVVKANQVKKLLEAERQDVTGLLGNFLGAVMRPGHAMMDLAKLERMAQRTSERIRGSAKRAVSSEPGRMGGVERAPRERTRPVARPSTSTDDRAEYKRRVAEVQAAQVSPEALRERIAARLGSIAQIAPNAATSVVAKSLQMTAYLAAQVPEHKPQDLLVPTQTIPPSTSQQQRFLRIARVVDDPMVAVSQLAAGKLTKDEADALRTNWPKIYDETREQVVDEVRKKGNKLPYQKRVQLGILFDIPTDVSMMPASIASAQAAYAQAAEQAQAQQPKRPPKSGPIPLANDLRKGMVQ